MKCIKIILFSLIIVVTTYPKAKTQSNDSLATKRAKSLQQLETNLEQRTFRVSEIKDRYRHALKNILTAQQWNQYEVEQQATQKVFEQHVQEQKIKYMLLHNE